MDAALWAAKTGLDAQQTEMSVISNNLANVNTTAYKEDRAVFEDLLYQNQTQVGADTSQTTAVPLRAQYRHRCAGGGYGKGVTARARLLRPATRSMWPSRASGFFQVQMPDGTLAYTRDGTFQTNAQGQLVTSTGYVVQPGRYHSPGRAERHHRQRWHRDGPAAGPIGAYPGRSVAARQLHQSSGAAADRAEPARAIRLERLATDRHARRQRARRRLPGSLESSNVDIVEELVNMIQTQRAYEMNSKAISTVDPMLQYATENM